MGKANEVGGVVTPEADVGSGTQVNLSTRPEKSVGTNEIWEMSEGALRQALEQKGWDYQVCVFVHFMHFPCHNSIAALSCFFHAVGFLLSVPCILAVCVGTRG